MRGFGQKKLESAVCRAKQINPQFASLRIPNRVKAVRGNGNNAVEEEEQGEQQQQRSAEEVDRELSEEIDAGIDLIEAEVEEEKRMAAAASATGLVVMALPADANGGSIDGAGGNPVPAPRQPRESHPYMNMQQQQQQSPTQPAPLVPNTLRPAVSVDGMQVRPTPPLPHLSLFYSFSV